MTHPLTAHQRKLLARLLDDNLKIQKSFIWSRPGAPARYALCRWNGGANAFLAAPAPSTVEPLIAAGYLRAVRPREPWLLNWWEISPAGRRALQAGAGPQAPAP